MSDAEEKREPDSAAGGAPEAAAESEVSKKSSNRKPLIGIGAAIVILIVVALILFWKNCRRGGGKGSSKNKPSPTASMTPSDPSMKPSAPTGPCKLRVDGKGLSHMKKTIEVAAAVAACKKLGSAEVLITGDAIQGKAKAIQAALKAAGIKAVIRRPAGAGMGPAPVPPMGMDAMGTPIGMDPMKKAP